MSSSNLNNSVQDILQDVAGTGMLPFGTSDVKGVATYNKGQSPFQVPSTSSMKFGTFPNSSAKSPGPIGSVSTPRANIPVFGSVSTPNAPVKQSRDSPAVSRITPANLFPSSPQSGSVTPSVFGNQTVQMSSPSDFIPSTASSQSSQSPFGSVYPKPSVFPSSSYQSSASSTFPSSPTRATLPSQSSSPRFASSELTSSSWENDSKAGFPIPSESIPHFPPFHPFHSPPFRSPPFPGSSSATVPVPLPSNSPSRSSPSRSSAGMSPRDAPTSSETVPPFARNAQSMGTIPTSGLAGSPFVRNTQSARSNMTSTSELSSSPFSRNTSATSAKSATSATSASGSTPTSNTMLNRIRDISNASKSVAGRSRASSPPKLVSTSSTLKEETKIVSSEVHDLKTMFHNVKFKVKHVKNMIHEHIKDHNVLKKLLKDLEYPSEYLELVSEMIHDEVLLEHSVKVIRHFLLKIARDLDHLSHMVKDVSNISHMLHDVERASSHSSPDKHSRQSQSPHRQSQSPHRQSQSPHRQSQSPHRQSQSPHKAMSIKERLSGMSPSSHSARSSSSPSQIPYNSSELSSKERLSEMGRQSRGSSPSSPSSPSPRSFPTSASSASPSSPSSPSSSLSIKERLSAISEARRSASSPTSASRGASPSNSPSNSPSIKERMAAISASRPSSHTSPSLATHHTSAASTSASIDSEVKNIIDPSSSSSPPVSSPTMSIKDKLRKIASSKSPSTFSSKSTGSPSHQEEEFTANVNSIDQVKPVEVKHEDPLKTHKDVFSTYGITYDKVIPDHENHTSFVHCYTRVGSKFIVEIKHHTGTTLYLNSGIVLEKHVGEELDISSDFLKKECKANGTCGFFGQEGNKAIVSHHDASVHKRSYIVSSMETERSFIEDHSFIALPLVQFEQLEQDKDSVMATLLYVDKKYRDYAFSAAFDTNETLRKAIADFDKSRSVIGTYATEYAITYENFEAGETKATSNIITAKEYNDETAFQSNASFRRGLFEDLSASVHDTRELTKVIEFAAGKTENYVSKLNDLRVHGAKYV